MEDWYSMVRQFKDETEHNSYETQELCRAIFRELRRMKIKEKGKFKQRMGPEFDNWILSLSERFPSYKVNMIVSDDEFWVLTLKLTTGM